MNRKSSSLDVSGGMMALARNMASEEKSVRTNAVTLLKNYITKRTEHRKFFDFSELKNLWKCLFYCMWITDKMINQEKLSKRFSKFTTLFGPFKEKMKFVKSFFAIMIQEWTGLDNHRQDKYLFLIRMMYRSSVDALDSGDFGNDDIEIFLQTFTKQVLVPSAETITVQYHFCDIYFEELALICGPRINHDLFVRLAFPFLNYLSFGNDLSLCRHIINDVFLELAGLSRHTLRRSLSENVGKIEIDRKLFLEHVHKEAFRADIAETNRSQLLRLLKVFRRQTFELPELQDKAVTERQKKIAKIQKRKLKEEMEVEKELEEKEAVKRRRLEKQKAEQNEMSGDLDFEEDESLASQFEGCEKQEVEMLNENDAELNSGNGNETASKKKSSSGQADKTNKKKKLKSKLETETSLLETSEKEGQVEQENLNTVLKTSTKKLKKKNAEDAHKQLPGSEQDATDGMNKNSLHLTELEKDREQKESSDVKQWNDEERRKSRKRKKKEEACDDTSVKTLSFGETNRKDEKNALGFDVVSENGRVKKKKKRKNSEKENDTPKQKGNEVTCVCKTVKRDDEDSVHFETERQKNKSNESNEHLKENDTTEEMSQSEDMDSISEQIKKSILEGNFDMGSISAFQVKQLFQQAPVKIKPSKHVKRKMKVTKEKENLRRKKKKQVSSDSGKVEKASVVNDKAKVAKKAEKLDSKKLKKMVDKQENLPVILPEPEASDFVPTSVSEKLLKELKREKKIRANQVFVPLEKPESTPRKPVEDFLTSEVVENLPSFARKIVESGVKSNKYKVKPSSAGSEIGANGDSKADFSLLKPKAERMTEGDDSSQKPRKRVSFALNVNAYKTGSFKPIK